MPSAADPFTDTHQCGDHHTHLFALSPSHLGQNNELQLSFPESSSRLSPSLYDVRANISPASPASFRSARSNPNLNANNAPPLSQLAHLDRASFTSSPMSTFSWADATSTPPAINGRRSVQIPASNAHPDDFVHLHDVDSEHAFSIGSYDDITGSSSHGAGDTPQSNHSYAGSVVDDDPTSPPHNSEQGSPRIRSPSSSSGWESVGSPSSDGRRLG
jgi:hypothetical protein